jgi:hypothetical protein
VIPGKAAWMLWKLGLVERLNAAMLRKCAAVEDVAVDRRIGVA